MQRSILFALVTFALSMPAFAQDQDSPEFSRFEIAGGYSFTTIEPESVTSLAVGHLDMPLGWTAGATYFIKEDTGLVFEYGRHAAQKDLGPVLGIVDGSARTILFGGRFVDRFSRFEFAIRAMGGITRTTTEGSTSATSARRTNDSSVTGAFGGGIDFLPGHFGVRLFHAEVVYVPVSKRTPSVNLATGVFYRF